jgi:DNA recombination protein RmuC
MNLPETIAVFVSCFASGLLLGWWVCKTRSLKPMAAKDIELAALGESIRHQKAQMESLKLALDQAQQEIKTLTRDLLATSEIRSAAESRLENQNALNASLQRREEEISRLEKKLASLETAMEKDRKSFEERSQLLQEVRSTFTDAYRALSAEALKENNRSFLDLAQTAFSKYLESAKTDFEKRESLVKAIIQPLKESLNRYEDHYHAMEKSRENAYGGLSAQVQALIKTQDELQKETGKLVNALRAPHVRGRWGEITLKRVVELAGMQDHCDFFEQTSTRSEDGVLRPDMIIHLPENRLIIIDAKVPLAAFLDAVESDKAEEREARLSAHANHVQKHILQLSQKAYWTQFNPTPEFVVLYIPGESFFSAALEKKPGLIELGAKKNVILATPTTLISLLRTVAFGWQQEKLTENAKKISELGTELYQRISTMSQHINALGHAIERCGQLYNTVVGSLERRVLVSARKFKDLGISHKETHEPLAALSIDTKTRSILPQEIDND